MKNNSSRPTPANYYPRSVQTKYTLSPELQIPTQHPGEMPFLTAQEYTKIIQVVMNSTQIEAFRKFEEFLKEGKVLDLGRAMQTHPVFQQHFMGLLEEYLVSINSDRDRTIPGQ